MHEFFNNSDKTPLPSVKTDRKQLKMNVNKTGEEIYIYNNKNMHVYLCKSTLTSLLLHCAFVVGKVYSKSQLIEIKLPKQLHRYFF